MDKRIIDMTASEFVEVLSEAMKTIQTLPPVSDKVKERILAREKLSMNPWVRSQTGLFPAFERVGK